MNQEDCIRFRKSCEIESPRFLESDRNSRHGSFRNISFEDENENDAPTRITKYGTKEWLDDDGELHRDGDQPAVISADSKFWYVHGKMQRDGDQPADIGADGSKSWWINAKCHREGDQPAQIWADGRKAWYIHGKRHRDGDQPAWIGSYGSKTWYVDGVKQDPPQDSNSQ